MPDDDTNREDNTSESEAGAPSPVDARVEDTPSETPRVENEQPRPSTRVNRRRPTRRSIGIAVALAGLCGLLGAEIVYIARSNPQPHANLQPQAPSVAPAVPSLSEPTVVIDAAVQEAPGIIASAEATELPPAEFSGEEGADEHAPAKPEKPKHFKTVHEASNGSCSTASVDGLSRQIIEQVRCTNPSAFVLLPSRPNLVLDAHIFPYLEASAREHLLKVLDGNRKRTMTVHSALRTVAQQYLVWRWSANRRCGVPLATPPGSSNHETGRALDIADQSQWRSAMEAQDFHWLGASDIVHFDYKTNRALGLPPDVLAFQRLWNRNHPEDRITESGRYDSSTEQRLKKSPPGGFASGSTCTKKSRR